MSSRLAIYLNDHLAGATIGVELARRLVSSNEDDEELAEPLKHVCAEIEADRDVLVELMERLGIGRSRLKPAAAWAAERLGRLKLNGQLTGYSPLSRLVELEALSIGISGKLQLWRTLERTLAGSLPDTDFAQLAERATGQRERVEALHRLAAERALAPAPASAD